MGMGMGMENSKTLKKDFDWKGKRIRLRCHFPEKKLCKVGNSELIYFLQRILDWVIEESKNYCLSKAKVIVSIEDGFCECYFGLLKEVCYLPKKEDIEVIYISERVLELEKAKEKVKNAELCSLTFSPVVFIEDYDVTNFITHCIEIYVEHIAYCELYSKEDIQLADVTIEDANGRTSLVCSHYINKEKVDKKLEEKDRALKIQIQKDERIVEFFRNLPEDFKDSFLFHYCNECGSLSEIINYIEVAGDRDFTDDEIEGFNLVKIEAKKWFSSEFSLELRNEYIDSLVALLFVNKKLSSIRYWQ